MDPLKMHFLLNMGIFHCYVSLPEGTTTGNMLSLIDVFLPYGLKIIDTFRIPSNQQKQQQNHRYLTITPLARLLNFL